MQLLTFVLDSSGGEWVPSMFFFLFSCFQMLIRRDLSDSALTGNRKMLLVRLTLKKKHLGLGIPMHGRNITGRTSSSHGADFIRFQGAKVRSNDAREDGVSKALSCLLVLISKETSKRGLTNAGLLLDLPHPIFYHYHYRGTIA